MAINKKKKKGEKTRKSCIFLYWYLLIFIPGLFNLKSDCDSVHINCSCPKADRIPIIEIGFIKDQREKVGQSGGKMVMNGPDKIVAQQQLKLVQRKEAANQKMLKG